MIINNYILVLPSWYPSTVSKYSGDFIQRHIQATSYQYTQHVIHVVKDENLTERKKIITQNYTHFSETIIYYKSLKTGIQLSDKIISHFTYLHIYKKAVKQHIEQNGLPALVHVHIGMKAGLIALWIKKKWKIKFIVSEQWTGYLKESDSPIYSLPYWYRRSLKKILKHASKITAVSLYLSKAIKRFAETGSHVIIPNVVNQEIFFKPPTTFTKKRLFIHASTMNYQKNIEATIYAMQKVVLIYPDIKLFLFGPIHDKIQTLVNTLGLNNHIQFKGERCQEELAKAMQESVLLILHSRFETFGCVLIEAHACEVPVLVSDFPVFTEIVKDKVNGLIVPLNNEEALVNSLLYAASGTHKFYNYDVSKYSFSTVGMQFANLYQEILTDFQT